MPVPYKNPNSKKSPSWRDYAKRSKAYQARTSGNPYDEYIAGAPNTKAKPKYLGRTYEEWQEYLRRMGLAPRPTTEAETMGSGGSRWQYSHLFGNPYDRYIAEGGGNPYNFPYYGNNAGAGGGKGSGGGGGGSGYPYGGGGGGYGGGGGGGGEGSESAPRWLLDMINWRI